MKYDSRRKIQNKEYPIILKKIQSLKLEGISANKIRALVAKEYKVSTKTIYYIEFPEMKQKDNEWRKKKARERYDREKNTLEYKMKRKADMKRYRARKRLLLSEGIID